MRTERKKISWAIAGFPGSNIFGDQSPEKYSFGWLPVIFAVCRLGTDKYTDIIKTWITQKIFFKRNIKED